VAGAVRRPPIAGRRTARAAPRTPADNPVELRIEAEVAWIEFGDPAALNLLTLPLLAALPEALRDADARGARVAVLRGRGEFFSAGYDIAQIPPELFATDARTVDAHPFERCMRAVAECPLPTIAAVNGHAIGGAVELAISCDLRLARAGARLGITAARLGLVYPHAGVEKLVRLVGPAHARRLLFTGDLVEAEVAERLGLVNQVVAAAEFDTAVEALARRIASSAPLAVRGMKQILRRIESGTPLTAADVHQLLELRARSYRSEDFREGRAAFATKRAPRFRGR
jgi:enoyl-CoA hydratase/carnithine racemase